MIDWRWVKKELLLRERVKRRDILKNVDKCLIAAKGLAAPKSASLKITKSIIPPGHVLSRYLRNADHFHAFVVTIGSGIEEKATLFMSQDKQLEGYLLDRIGSFAVESLAQCFEENLRKKYAREGKGVSARVSPGYCDWPIEGQFALDNILVFRKAGVRLTESCMMVPRKSISAIVGVGREGSFPKAGSQCIMCGSVNCDYRRGPYKPCSGALIV